MTCPNCTEAAKRTGWPPGLLQDDDRKLSRALANTPHARRHAEEAAFEARQACLKESRDGRTADRTGAPGQPDGGTMEGAVEELLLGQGGVPVGEQSAGLRQPAAAAEGGDAFPTDVYKCGGIWHARRQPIGGRLVTGVGYTRDGALADLESQWGMA